LLGCLARDRVEVPEQVIAPYLCSENWRERIDAAVVLDRVGFGSPTADILAREAGKPYPFKEIMGIGKSHYDVNFRDKCYMVAALAHHAPDVRQLSVFADPKGQYRDIRYGLAIGLGRRGTSDGVELLVLLATGDPISVVRRQARESLRQIQETRLMAGDPIPTIRLPAELPWEAHYPPRGLDWPGPLQLPSPTAPPPNALTLEQLVNAVAAGLSPHNYRDLNNANNQAPGATRMMVKAAADFDRAVRQLFAEHTDSVDAVARDLLDSPYPFAHYLACRELGNRSAVAFEDYLVKRLSAFAQSADTVGFFWTCEALAQIDGDAAIDALKPYARDQMFPGVHGPVGMGFGYPAAKALARMAGDASHPEVARLLASENAWLQAGAIAGLVETNAPGVRALLQRLLERPQPAVVRNHAQVGLTRLGWDPTRHKRVGQTSSATGQSTTTLRGG
jgi:HEAT repeat protein